MVHVIEPRPPASGKRLGRCAGRKGVAGCLEKTEAEWKIVGQTSAAPASVIAATLLRQDAYKREPLDKWNAHAQRCGPDGARP